MLKILKEILKKKLYHGCFQYIDNFELRNKLFEFGWKHGISIFSWPICKKKFKSKNKKDLE